MTEGGGGLLSHPSLPLRCLQPGSGFLADGCVGVSGNAQHWSLTKGAVSLAIIAPYYS